METSGSDAGKNRIAALEAKVGGVGVLVEEFTHELLDLKAVTREMSWQTKEHHPQEPGTLQGADTVLPAAAEVTAPQEEGTPVPAGGACAEDPVPDDPVVVMIMQTDGTMKPEIRRGSKNCLFAPAGYGVSGGSGRIKKRKTIMPGQSRLT